jgi:hypothetical protein
MKDNAPVLDGHISFLKKLLKIKQKKSFTLLPFAG